MAIMQIQRSKHEPAYRCGQKLYEGKLRITDAKKELAAIGINPNSAADIVYALVHLLKGERYKRTLSANLTTDFFQWIHRDYGVDVLKRAVSSLRQHIEYYESLGKGGRKALRPILEKYAAMVVDQDEDSDFPDEVHNSGHFPEGATKQVTVNVYERSVKARRACLNEYGYICSVCGFDFEKVFGAIGNGFIHVHHLIDLASIGKEYKVNPKDDLRPVCPNCHAMLHKSKPAYSIEELKKVISARRA